LSKAWDAATLEELLKQEIFGRGAELWEVANTIVWLASDYSSYLSGESISVSSQHP
jgi:3-oxoacyl-[acyl-carrier protein] reductase